MDMQQTTICYLNKWVVFGLMGVLSETSLVYEDTLFVLLCFEQPNKQFLKTSPFQS